MRIIIIIFFLNGFLFSTSPFETLSEITLNLDKDNNIDTIRLREDLSNNNRFLKVIISEKEQQRTFDNHYAIPNYQESTLSCTKIYKDTIGFKFIIKNGNGNISKSKIFYFKALKTDIVLYKMEEMRFYEDNFIQELNVTNYEYNNRNVYDSIYSLKHFNYRDFW